MSKLLSIVLLPTRALLQEDNHAYHGEMSGEEAEKVLEEEKKKRKGGEPCYLIRFSNAHKKYILSLTTEKHGFRHYEISIDNDSNRYEIVGTEKSFSDVYSLLEYYQDHPVDVQCPGIGRPCFRVSTMEDNAIKVTESQEEADSESGETAEEHRTLQGVLKHNDDVKKTLLQTNQDLRQKLTEQQKVQEQLLQRLAPRAQPAPPSEELLLLKGQISRQQRVQEQVLERLTQLQLTATAAAPPSSVSTSSSGDRITSAPESAAACSHAKGSSCRIS